MNRFSDTLEEWYRTAGRKDLPWRDIRDPYRIWISEIILQQTRVAQGMDYYHRFIEHFPDVFSLADAEEDEVLKLWQGLGYYSRARNLHAAAKAISKAGSFPTTYDGVRAMKGVGDYTAAAICSFAYRLPYPVVDGNVYRVLSRIFGIETPIDSTDGKKEFRALAEQLLDKEHPDIFNSAIMDFGAIQCTPKTPDCLFCPFAGECAARLSERIESLPVKSKKTAVKQRWIVYLYLESSEQLLLHRRPEGDIWQGLYEPYLMEFDHVASETEIKERINRELPEIGRYVTENENRLEVVAKGLKHILTHRHLWIDCYRIRVEQLPTIIEYLPVPKAQRDTYATSKIVTSLFAMIG